MSSLRDKLDVEILDYRPKAAGTMFGFADIKLSFNSGCVVEVFDCALHKKESDRWVNLPSKQFKKRDGSNGYSKLVIFDPSLMAAFQSTVFERLEQYVEGGHRG